MWACEAKLADGSWALMGWECATREEAEDIRADVIFNNDHPADLLRVRSDTDPDDYPDRDLPAGTAANEVKAH